MKDTDILYAVRDSLDSVHLDRPLETVLAAGRAHRRRAALARTSIAMLAVALLGAGALAYTGNGGPPVSDGGGGPGRQAQVLVRNSGYSLVRNVDGSITFTINDVIDPAAATAALNNAGITGRVIRLGADPSCTMTTRRIDPADTSPTADENIRALGDGKSTATFRSSDYPDGGGLLLLLVKFEPLLRPGRSPVPPGPPFVFVIYFNDVAKIPTCISADVEPGTGS